MAKQKMNLPAQLLSVVTLSVVGLLLSGCTTTPDESYKKAEMTKPLDYPPDLIAPLTSERFAIPAADADPVTTPISLPETSPAPHRRSSGGGHSH